MGRLSKPNLKFLTRFKKKEIVRLNRPSSQGTSASKSDLKIETICKRRQCPRNPASLKNNKISGTRQMLAARVRAD